MNASMHACVCMNRWMVLYLCEIFDYDRHINLRNGTSGKNESCLNDKNSVGIVF